MDGRRASLNGMETRITRGAERSPGVAACGVVPAAALSAISRRLPGNQLVAGDLFGRAVATGSGPF